MKNYSIWKDNIELPEFNKLNKDIEVDVLIIGGGMTGINTLYQLSNTYLEVVLVEQNKIGMGVTANTTGKITYLQDSIYEKIINNFDEVTAIKYLESQKTAIDLIVKIIKEENIDCDLIKVPSYVYSNTQEEDEKLDELKNFLLDNNIKVIEGKSNLVEYKNMIGVEDTYLFHPLKYLKGLLKVLDKNTIYEDTSIIKMDKYDKGYICYTNNDKTIKANKVVIASHYPYFNLPFMFPLKGSLEKSYLSASTYKEDNLSLIKYSDPYISIRSYLDKIIYLSNSHDNNTAVDDKEHFKELKSKLKELNLKPEYMWSNIDIMTSDSLPYIGKIDEDLLIGTGYNTWGMTNSIIASKIISDIIKNNQNEYLELFNPKRINFETLIGTLSNTIKNVEGLVNGMINTNNNIEYKTLNNKEIAIYKDNLGNHLVYTKCPHQGCKLLFNEIEKTWDCPCHASRFDIDGKCISGPANKDITVTDEDNTLPQEELVDSMELS